MPKIPRPLEIIRFIAVAPSERPTGEEGVTVLVEAVGGEWALKLTPEVAEAIYHGVYGEVRGN
jgi:hypothetical protein